MEEILKKYQESEIEKRLETIKGWEQERENCAIPWLIFALGDPEWRVRKAASSALLQFDRDVELVEALIGALKNEKNAGSRNAAVEVLTHFGHFSVFPLMSIFREVDHDVKKFILDILGDIGDPRATQFFVKALNDKNENVRLAAVEALGKFKDNQVVPNLISLLEFSSPLLNFTIVRSLELIGDSRALDPLVSMMNKKGLEKVVLEALGSFGDLRALNPILSSLQGGGKSIKKCAVRSLLKLSTKISKHQEILITSRLREIYSQGLGHFLMEALEDPDLKIKSGAVKIFGWVREFKAITKLIPFLEGDLRDVVVETFIHLGREAVDVLIIDISRYPEKVREEIGFVLGEIGDRRAVSALIQLLEDPVGHVRQSGANSLGKLGDRNAVRPLIRTLEDPYPNVQEAVLEALLLIGGEQVVQSLKGMVHHDSPRMRCHAITLLGKLAPMENQNEIFMALKDENPDVRKTAITALEGMRTEESTLCILGALGDEEPQVRLCALNVLFQNNKENWVKHMAPLAKDENIWVRASIARGLGHFGKKGKPLLLDLLNDKVGVVQIAAMEALGKIQETSVVPLILTKVQTTDPDIKVAAIDSLGCIGDPSVKESLRIFLKDTHWNVRAATANALGKLKDAAVRESLLRLANHDQDSLVRQSARFALDQIQET